MANNPIMMVDAVALPPNDDEIEMVKDLDEIEDRLAELYDLGAMDLECYEELGYYFSLITQNKWYKKTEQRMERKTLPKKRELLTQLQKSEHPDYKDWCCPECRRYYKGSKALKYHKDRDICDERHNDLIVKATKEQIVSPKFLHTTAAMTNLVARAIMYKKNIEPELEEEELSESEEESEEEDLSESKEECVYVIQTWEHSEKGTIEYAGLWEDSEGNKEFKTEDEATLQYEYATDGQQGYCGVTLVKIDPNNPVRETCIYDWEDNISDYGDYCETCECLMTEEDKDLELDLEKAELIDGRNGKNCIKCWKNFMT